MTRRWASSLSDEDVDRVSEGVISYGRTQAVGGEPQAIACGLHDEAGRLIAGATGRTEFKRLYVNYLWVDEALRGYGLGTEALRQLEAQALARGCVDALIETLSDRTAHHYEHLGYVPMARIADYVPGFTRHVLIKCWVPRA